MQTVVYPKERTISFVGDLDLLDAAVEYYVEDEHTNQSIKSNKYSGIRTINGVIFPGIKSEDDRSEFRNRQFGTRFSYHNYSNRDVLVVDRSNLIVTIKPERTYFDEPHKLIIRKEYHFETQAVASQAYQNVGALNTLHGNELTKMLPHLGTEPPYCMKGRCISVEYVVLLSDIENADGELFHLPTDTLISLLSVKETNKHPASPEYIDSKIQYPSCYPATDNDVGIIFRYITDNTKALPKYLRICNKVFKLEPQHFNPAKLMDVTLKDKTTELRTASEYIECLYPTKIDALRSKTKGYRCNRISLSDAKEKYGIFDTIEEANAPLANVEKVEQRLRDKIEQLELDQKQQQREHKDKLRHVENDLRAKQSEFDDLKRSKQAQTEKQKEMNEQASYQRKNHFEFFKFILGTVTAMLAIVPILLKLKQSK